jgi:hypothetical protein
MCGHSNVQLTSPPVLIIWGTQGYLWLPYDLMEIINLIGERFKPKKFFFQKNTLCHSFRITVIPSGLLSFLPDYCHSFRIIGIPSVLVSFFPNIVIPSKFFRELKILTSSKSFPYPKGEKNGYQRWPYLRVIMNCTVRHSFRDFMFVIKDAFTSARSLETHTLRFPINV